MNENDENRIMRLAEKVFTGIGTAALRESREITLEYKLSQSEHKTIVSSGKSDIDALIMTVTPCEPDDEDPDDEEEG